MRDLIRICSLRFQLLLSCRYIISIIRNMDLMHIGKYESIAERIKRLNTPTPNPHASGTIHTKPNLQKMRNYLSPVMPSYQKSQPVDAFKVSFQEKRTPSRMPTQQTQQVLNQQSKSYIDDLITLKDQRLTNITNRGQITTLRGNDIDDSFLDSYRKEKQPFPPLPTSQKKETQVAAKKIGHVKSQSTLKIDEIMESYNSYRLNKQQFIEEIEKNSKPTHFRCVSKNLREEIEKEQEEVEETKQINQNEQSFSRIDTIWKETPLHQEEQYEEEERPVMFQRRYKHQKIRTEQKEQDEQMIQQMTPTWEVEDKPLNMSKSKQILKNLMNLASPNNRNSEIGAMLSPRAMRAPGKICKNIDRSLINNIMS